MTGADKQRYQQSDNLLSRFKTTCSKATLAKKIASELANPKILSKPDSSNSDPMVPARAQQRTAPPVRLSKTYCIAQISNPAVTSL